MVVEDTPDLNGAANFTNYIKQLPFGSTITDKLDAKVEVKGVKLSVVRTDRYSNRSQANTPLTLLPYVSTNVAPRIKFAAGEDGFRVV